MERLRHFTGETFTLDRNREYIQTDRMGIYTKPMGLWITPLGEDDWPTWCRAEGFGTNRLEHENVVELMADANVLWITNEEEFLKFEEKYMGPPDPVYTWTKKAGIDWVRVIQDYAGVFIVPYLWSMRWDHDWYNGWDVSSGCVWDLSAIKQVFETTKELTA